MKKDDSLADGAEKAGVSLPTTMPQSKARARLAMAFLLEYGRAEEVRGGYFSGEED